MQQEFIQELKKERNELIEEASNINDNLIPTIDRIFNDIISEAELQNEFSLSDLIRISNKLEKLKKPILIDLNNYSINY